MARALGYPRPMRITKAAVVRTCSICERTLLMGERATRFSPDGHDFVDVCPLCQDTALEHGWVKEGSPTTPMLPADRRRRRPALGRLLSSRRGTSPEPVVSDPILRRLSEPELAMVEAADLFNASDYRRSVDGIAKSLGRPKASIVRLSGTSGDLVITVVWDISWYQYRVAPDSAQPVRLAGRGYDPSELESSFTAWNARLDDDGRIVPNIERI
jgi:hypothetical protein